MEIFWTAKIKMPNESAFKDFLNGMSKRIIQGHCRYGAPKKEKKYMTRLKLEVSAYSKSGNAEHLYNIANYCHLEMYAPEHKRFHFDSTVGSATRGRIKGGG